MISVDQLRRNGRAARYVGKFDDKSKTGVVRRRRDRRPPLPCRPAVAPTRLRSKLASAALGRILHLSRSRSRPPGGRSHGEESRRSGRRGQRQVETLSVEEAKPLVGQRDVQFVDVRDGAELASEGQNPGRGARPARPARVLCRPASPTTSPSSPRASAWWCTAPRAARSALAAKTLKDMGIGRVANMLGGFNAWQQAGGEIER